MEEYTEKAKLINRSYFKTKWTAITNFRRNNRWKKL